MEEFRIAVANEDEGTSPRFQHEGEIFGNHKRPDIGINLMITGDMTRDIQGDACLGPVVECYRIVAPVDKAGFAAQGSRDTFHCLAHTDLRMIARCLRKGTDSSRQFRGLRDHIKGLARVKLRYRDHKRIERIGIARDNSLQEIN